MESLLTRRKYLFEAEDDETSNDTTDETPVDGDTGNSDSSEDTNDNNGSDSSDDQNEDNNDDEDYTIDAEPDDTDNEESTDSGDDNSDSDDSDTDDISSTDTAEESPVDQEMFDSLSEDEKNRKIYTLKKQYIDLYSNCTTLIDKFNQISDEDDENVNPVIKRVLKIIYDLKEYISYYVLNAFGNKSYIENDINFARYLSILNGIKLIVEELQKSQEDENK